MSQTTTAYRLVEGLPVIPWGARTESDQDIDRTSTAVTELLDENGWFDCVLDLAQVRLFSGYALSKIIRLWKRSNDRKAKFVVCGACRMVREVWDVTRIDRVIDLHAEDDPDADLVGAWFEGCFPRVHFDPMCLAWNGHTVPRLARGIRLDKDFEAMPILGDALEEAGCLDPTVIRHCREECEHGSQCWVLRQIAEQAPTMVWP